MSVDETDPRQIADHWTELVRRLWDSLSPAEDQPRKETTMNTEQNLRVPMRVTRIEEYEHVFGDVSSEVVTATNGSTSLTFGVRPAGRWRIHDQLTVTIEREPS